MEKIKIRMLAALALAACAAHSVQHAEIDPLATRWTFGAHEPYATCRRVGNHCTGGIDGRSLRTAPCPHSPSICW